MNKVTEEMVKWSAHKSMNGKRKNYGKRKKERKTIIIIMRSFCSFWDGIRKLTLGLLTQ